MHWIKTSEKMPEKDGRYIVYVVYPSYPWTGVSSLRQGRFDDELASHWMPLPAPPENK